jgi:endoglucanase
MSSGVFLQTRGSQFVTRAGDPIKLHGIGLGGWLNMENFIVGFPATESLNRQAVRGVLGDELGELFFERFLDVFFTDEDAAAIADCGFNVVRIPVHYRHLEDDARPFELKESGLRRLDSAIEACARHGLYTIIDLHVLPGAQNNEWHCDNPTHHAGFWGHRHFEERALHIWRELATRYRDNQWVAGYEPINEPGDPTGEDVARFFPELLQAIREVDPEHILFLKGNAFGPEFAFYKEPLPNTVFIAFDYAVPGAAGAVAYPGTTNDVYYDKSVLEQRFLELTQQARDTRTPIWVGEFGPVYSGDQTIDDSRYQVLADQLEIYRAYDASWSLWTWKDINVQGVVYVDPTSPYITRTQPVLTKKARLATDAWGHVDDEVRDVLDPLKDRFATEFPDHPDAEWLVNRLVRHILFAEPMVKEWAECFKGLSKDGLEEVLSSFELANCVTREPLVDAVKAAIAADSASSRVIGGAATR